MHIGFERLSEDEVFANDSADLGTDEDDESLRQDQPDLSLRAQASVIAKLRVRGLLHETSRHNRVSDAEQLATRFRR